MNEKKEKKKRKKKNLLLISSKSPGFTRLEATCFNNAFWSQCIAKTLAKGLKSTCKGLAKHLEWVNWEPSLTSDLERRMGEKGERASAEGV